MRYLSRGLVDAEVSVPYASGLLEKGKKKQDPAGQKKHYTTLT